MLCVEKKNDTSPGKKKQINKNKLNQSNLACIQRYTQPEHDHRSYNKSMSMFVRSFVHSLCIRYDKHASQFVVSTTSSHSLPWHEKARLQKETIKKIKMPLCTSNSSKDESYTCLRVSVLRRLRSNDTQRAQGRGQSAGLDLGPL